MSGSPAVPWSPPAFCSLPHRAARVPKPLKDILSQALFNFGAPWKARPKHDRMLSVAPWCKHEAVHWVSLPAFLYI